MTDDDTKIIKRTTTFTFNSDRDMVNAFFDVSGVNIRRERVETVYNWRNFKNINSESASILTALGQEYETERRCFMVNGWESKREIVDALELPVDCAFDWWTRAVHITTYNLSEDQHKTEMRKIYLPMIEKGYNVYHRCETVVTNANC